MNYTLKELLDIPKLLELLDSLDEAHSMPSAIIDTEGNILTATAWQDICTKFHRVNPDTEKKCIESDRHVEAGLGDGMPHVFYRCPMGLLESATPIIVDGEHLGNVFMGQFFWESPEETYFIEQARRYGFDEGEYLAAMRKVPIFSEEQLRKNLTFIGKLAQMLAEQSLQGKRQLEAEEILKESEKLYRSLFENMMNGFAYCQMLYVDGKPDDFIYLAVNDIFVSQTGLKDVVGRKVTEVIPDIREADHQLIEIYGRVAMTGQSERFEIFVEALQMWFMVSVYSPSHDHFVALFDVITERKQAEEALRESEQRLSFHVDNSPLATIEWDSDFIVTRWAGEAEKIFGWNHAETIGKPIMDLNMVYEEDIPVVQKTMEQLAEGISKYVVSGNRNYTKERKIIYCEWYNTVLRNPQGKMVSVLSQVMDITERKTSAEKLRKSEERYKELFAGAGDGIIVLSTEGRLIQVNESFARMHGYSVQEMKQMSLKDLDTPEAALLIPERMQRLLSGEALVFEVEHYRKDGHIFPLEVSASFIFSDGESYLQGFHRDITDRKRAEEEKLALQQQLQQSQKLESLGVLAGGIAHDFNNILAIIVGNCFLAKMNPDEVNGSITAIEKASERAAELCRQMLAYAGKSQFVSANVNMTTLVEDMVKMLKATINQNVVIKLDVADDIPTINADVSLLKQIVMNLIVNASEAIGEAQGEILVTLAKKTVKARQKEKDFFGNVIASGLYIFLEVSDTGCGMDDETKQRIFEPFYTTKFTGRGLGMSAVLGVITSHKGAIQLSSQQGRGTTIKVYLPVQIGDVKEDKSPRQVASAPWQGSGTVLLVEDEELFILLATDMLKKLGFKVIGASNGKEALEKYRKNASEITLVVTDIGMPVMDGYALFRELKKLNPLLPIIVSSGFGDEVVTSRIPREDIAGMVNKPYRFDQLRDVLKGVL